MTEMDRRQLLAAGALAGTAVVLDPMRLRATGDSQLTATLSGQIPYGAPDWIYIPVPVPAGVNRISVAYSYDKPTPPPGYDGNALDIGVFDSSGYQLGPAAGFRGWSGGFRSSFTISNSDATPGYLPGPVQPGTWHVIVGPYKVVPVGLQWTVTVTLDFGTEPAPFVPHHAPWRAAGRGRAWYRGDMHLHTVHSDGRRLPSEVAAGARAAGLDYIVSTDHNTSSAAGIWGDFAGPDLLIIDGEEITTRNGHYTALGLPAGTWIDWRYRAVDGGLARFVREIHDVGGLAVAAHPSATCVGCGWKFGFAGLDAVEVWNGPWTVDDDAVVSAWDNLLVASGRSGNWIPAVGDSDAHSAPQVIGLPHNVVYADDLDRRSILAAVRAGRVWLAESSTVDLSFTAGSASGSTARIGGRLAVPDDAPVTVALSVTGVPGASLRLITDQGQRTAATAAADGTGALSWATTPQNSRYVRAEVRHPDNSMAAMTNPIFLGTTR